MWNRESYWAGLCSLDLLGLLQLPQDTLHKVFSHQTQSHDRQERMYFQKIWRLQSQCLHKKKLEAACIQQINLLEPWKRGQKATPIKCLISFLGEFWPQIFLIFVLAYLPYPWQLSCKFTPSSSPTLMGLKQDFFISFVKVRLGNPILFPFL